MALDATDSTKVLGQVTKLKEMFGFDESTNTYNNREGLGEFLNKFDKAMQNEEKKKLLYDSLGVTYMAPIEEPPADTTAGGDDFTIYEGEAPSYTTEDLIQDVKGKEKAALEVLNTLKASDEFEEYQNYYALSSKYEDKRQLPGTKIDKRNFVRSDEDVVTSKNEYYQAMRDFGHGGMFSNEATMFLSSGGGLGFAGGMLADNTREGLDEKFEIYFTNPDGTKKKGYNIIKRARENYFQNLSVTQSEYDSDLEALESYENKYFATDQAKEEYQAYEKTFGGTGEKLSYEDFLAQRGYDFNRGDNPAGYNKDVKDAINALNLIREELDVLNERPEAIGEFDFFQSLGLQ